MLSTFAFFNASRVIRLLLAGAILFSIVTTYYVMVVQKDYTILSNPEGPDTSDYFEE